ncbi:MAG: replication initiator protein A, partial [Ruminococcaceae bacterium]|nr:replication initiator protein A [Oscillospiraceae bacterium]
MQFEYFYGGEAEQFSFFRIPKLLFRDEAFKSISTDAKVLYGLMLDRMSLSLKNNWIDTEGRVYIIYTIADIMEDMNCADQKAGKLLTELDNNKGIGLIERKRQGLGKPNIIYVKNFVSPSLFLNRENHDSGKVLITNQEIRKSLTS